MKEVIFYALLGSFLLPFNSVFGLDAFKSSHTVGRCFFFDGAHVVRIGESEDKTYAIALTKEVIQVQGNVLNKADSKLYLLVTLNDEQSEDYWKSDLSTLLSNFEARLNDRSIDHPFVKRCEEKETFFSRAWYALFEDRTNIETYSKDCLAQWDLLYQDLQTVGRVSFTKEPPVELIEAQRDFAHTVDTFKEELVSLVEDLSLLPLSVAGFVKTDQGNGSFIKFLEHENSTSSI